jgi:hypothetical protein
MGKEDNWDATPVAGEVDDELPILTAELADETVDDDEEEIILADPIIVGGSGRERGTNSLSSRVRTATALSTTPPDPKRILGW